MQKDFTVYMYNKTNIHKNFLEIGLLAYFQVIFYSRLKEDS